MVSLGDEYVDIQMTLPLVGLLRQYVPRMRMAALDFSGRRQAHALRGSFMCFKFRHV